jgi:hypothetical protein
MFGQSAHSGFANAAFHVLFNSPPSASSMFPNKWSKAYAWQTLHFQIGIS